MTERSCLSTREVGHRTLSWTFRTPMLVLLGSLLMTLFSMRADCHGLRCPRLLRPSRLFRLGAP